MSVKVTISVNEVKAKIQGANEKALKATAGQVLSDCNKFCPEDQGELVESSSSHSDFGKGLLVWSTPYARYLYYGILMIDPVTKSSYARKGINKIATSKALNYHQLSQEVLALNEDVSVSRLRDIEHGCANVTIDTLECIAKAVTSSPACRGGEDVTTRL